MAIRASSLDVPIHVVGIGDPILLKISRSRKFFVRDKAYPDEPFEVEALLQATSTAGDVGDRTDHGRSRPTAELTSAPQNLAQSKL